MTAVRCPPFREPNDLIDVPTLKRHERERAVYDAVRAASHRFSHSIMFPECSLTRRGIWSRTHLYPGSAGRLAETVVVSNGVFPSPNRIRKMADDMHSVDHGPLYPSVDQGVIRPM